MSLLDSFRCLISPRYRAIQELRRQTREERDSLIARGLIEKVLMLPAEFGGTDDPRNLVYLPINLVSQKRAFDAEVMRRIQNGEDLQYAVTPNYDNDSVVPGRLHMEAIGGQTSLKEIIEVAPHRTWESKSG